MPGKALCVVLVLVLTSAVAFSPGPAGADDTPLAASIPPGGWEYAELRIIGSDGVLITAHEAMFLEGPEGRSARAFIKLDNDHLRVGPSFRVLHLTRAGSQGWELVSEISPDVYLLKRRYDIKKPTPEP